MVRKKTDPFWQHVDELPKNRWQCKFCGNEYPGHASRIKAHLGQVKNRGIEICDKVSEAVKEEALRALHKVAPDTQQNGVEVEETTQRNDRRIGFESNPYVVPEAPPITFDNNELHPPISDTQFQQADLLPNSDPQQQSEVNTMISTVQDLQQQSIDQQGATEHPVTLHTNFNLRLHYLKGKLKRRRDQKEEMEAELYQWSKKLKKQMEEKEEKEEKLHQWRKETKEIEDAYRNMKKEQKEGRYPSLEQLNQVEKLINQVEELGDLDMFEKETSRITASSKTLLSTSKLIGRDNEKSEIWGSLVKDGILRLGVYGMGGVGKTEIMKNIYDELHNDEAFDNVFWVTMPKDSSVYKLQGVIASAMHLDELFNEHNEKIRAATLNQFLTSGKKYVMILDGLWEHFNYNDVGIPSTYDGLKLVIISRSLDVSEKMFCQATIKILPFERWKGDDWKLFSHELGVEMELPEKVKNIAEEIVKICGGLPLYIKEIATRMKGVDSEQEWNAMMKKLNNPKARFHEFKGQVLDRLKLSYEFLDDHQLQQCLIFCAFSLSSRNWPVEEFLVDVGFIDGWNKKKKLSHNARDILRELEKACLFDFSGTLLMMHISIIDMIWHVATDANLFMDDLGIALKDIIEEEFQIGDLDELYLMKDAANEISRLSLNESRLPILVSNQNSRLRMIPNSLFTTFSELRILNLSTSCIEALPNSFSDLVNLTVLVLQGCSELRHIPYIGKLTSLRKLNLHDCNSLENLPDGLAYLVNLENLDLHGTHCVNAKELEGLTKLKKLFCRFSTLEELTIFAGSFHGKANADILYDILVSSDPREKKDDDYENKRVVRDPREKKDDDYENKRVVRDPREKKDDDYENKSRKSLWKYAYGKR